MNELVVITTKEIFERDFNIYGTIEEPLFLAKDIAEMIEYSNISMMLRCLDDNEKVKISPKESYGVFRANNSYWFITERGLKKLLSSSNKLKSKELLKEIDNNYIYKNTPKQVVFEDMLKNAIDTHLNKSNLDWKFCPFNDKDKYLLTYKEALTYISEYKIGNYRVDFYFPNFNLIVEYDEKYHNAQLDKDKEREYNILKILENRTIEDIKENGSKYNFIRVKENEEFEGVIKIISYLMHYAFVY